MRLQRTLDGSIEGPDASLRSYVVFSASPVFFFVFYILHIVNTMLAFFYE